MATFLERFEKYQRSCTEIASSKVGVCLSSSPGVIRCPAGTTRPTRHDQLSVVVSRSEFAHHLRGGDQRLPCVSLRAAIQTSSTFSNFKRVDFSRRQVMGFAVKFRVMVPAPFPERGPHCTVPLRTTIFQGISRVQLIRRYGSGRHQFLARSRTLGATTKASKLDR